MTVDRFRPMPLIRGDLPSGHCASRRVLRHTTGRGGVLVLIVLLDGTVRFGELRRKIGGVKERMPAQTLYALAGDGSVLQVPHKVVPPHVEYSLAPPGKQVAAQVCGSADRIEARLLQIASSCARGQDGAVPADDPAST